MTWWLRIVRWEMTKALRHGHSSTRVTSRILEQCRTTRIAESRSAESCRIATNSPTGAISSRLNCGTMRSSRVGPAPHGTALCSKTYFSRTYAQLRLQGLGISQVSKGTSYKGYDSITSPLPKPPRRVGHAVMSTWHLLQQIMFIPRSVVRLGRLSVNSTKCSARLVVVVFELQYNH